MWLYCRILCVEKRNGRVREMGGKCKGEAEWDALLSHGVNAGRRQTHCTEANPTVVLVTVSKADAPVVAATPSVGRRS